MRTTALRTRDGCPIFYGQAASIVDFISNMEPSQLCNLDLSFFDLRALDWNERCGNDIDLTHANLCGANITQGAFEDCDFSFALLPYLCASLTKFVRCNFSECEFGATDVSGCIFEDCTFSGPGFFRLDLSHAEKIHNCRYIVDETTSLTFHASPMILHGYKSPLAFFENNMICATPPKLHSMRACILETQPKINQGLV